eukprot:TRINITY_DN72428_c0_g1_i1.p1 TRINITY_DN72428_c0_g1~~TRINITY_DN72428_c0_g1_i1.p1  ORF type:complete len:664 (+),score=119.39 TRINITY_DN72428_c0_g1_i1:56-2047(+)
MKRSATFSDVSFKGVQATFSVIAQIEPSCQIRVVGSVGALGLWRPENGLALGPHDATGSIWSGTAQLPKQEHVPDGIEYKFIQVQADGSVIWEDDIGNRIFDYPALPGVTLVPTAQFGTLDPAPILHVAASEALHQRKAFAVHTSPVLLPLEAFAGIGNRADPKVSYSSALGKPIVSEKSQEQQQIMLTVSDECVTSVEVEFELAQMKMQLKRDGNQQRNEPCGGYADQNSQSSRWSLPFSSTKLKPGIHNFHFFVDGVRELSKDHSVRGEANVALFSGQLWKYVRGYRTVEHQERCTESFDLNAGSDFRQTASCGAPSPLGQVGRPRSIGHNLASLGGESSDESESDDEIEEFPAEICEGLYDRELRLRLYQVNLPKPDGTEILRLQGGTHVIGKDFGECEDAHFVHTDALGVADGVGSMVAYKHLGVDAADYAAGLMSLASRSLLPGGEVMIDETLETAEKRALAACTIAEREVTGFGAATMLTLVLSGCSIGVANLGDSGFMLLRQGLDGMKIVSKSREMQHGWNFPYQFCRLPPTLESRMKALKVDHASDCQLYSETVCAGDLILLFSDGVSDNLHEQEILDVVNKALSPAFAELLGLPERATHPEQIAKALASAAQLRSRDQKAKVPFYHYSKKHGYDCIGGKADDITVVAAWVVAER